MNKNFEIENCKALSLQENDFVIKGLQQLAKKAKNLPAMDSFAIKIKQNTQLIGAISGFILYGCLHIDLLFIDEQFRHLGLGTKLMNLAQEKAMTTNCTFIIVTTMDWEAKDFYLKHNYIIEYIRQGFEKNSAMYILRKNL